MIYPEHRWKSINAKIVCHSVEVAGGIVFVIENDGLGQLTFGEYLRILKDVLQVLADDEEYEMAAYIRDQIKQYKEKI